MCGTPEYMSPEQGRGDPIDARSDLYAVGVIFYQMLTGRLPFEAESPTQVVLMHIGTAPPDPRKVAPERQIPEALVNVLLMAMAKDSSHRFSDADEFSEALADAMAQVEGSASTRAAASAQIKCPTCGAMNSPSQKFCGDCGGALSSSVLHRARSDAAREHPPSVHAPRSEVATGTRGVTIPEERFASRSPSSGARTIRSGSRSDATTPRERSAARGSSGRRGSERPACSASSSSSARPLATRRRRRARSRVGRERRTTLSARRSRGSPRSRPTAEPRKEWVGAGSEARRGLMDIFGKEDSTTNDALTPEDRRYAATEAFRWSLIRASERAHGQRVIVAIDDLHSVDGASRNAFADSIAEPPLIPALLVATYPPGFDPSWAAGAAAARVLTGLSPPVVAKLLTATGVTSIPASFTGTTRGIAPLHLEQLLRFTREQGSGAPTRLADLMALRVERLSADARRVLQAIAVYGDDAGDDAITKLVPEDTNLASALSLLLRAGMIEDATDGLRTSHPLLREIVLATIPAAVRKDLHHRAAEVCEATHAGIEVLAMHEYFAQNTFQALILLERVAMRCAARGDLHGSVNALRRGLELARRELFRGEIDDPMRAVLIFSRKLGEALAQVGDFTDAEGVLREALDMTGPSGQDRARVLGTLATVSHGRDRIQEALLYLVEAIELAHESGSRDLAVSLEDLRSRWRGDRALVTLSDDGGGRVEAESRGGAGEDRREVRGGLGARTDRRRDREQPLQPRLVSVGR